MGYKIALELMCKCRVKHVREIGIRFGLRLKGQSKLSLKEQFNYLQHLSRLYDFTFPRATPILKFLVVLTGGLLAALGVFALARWCGVNRLASASGGYLANIVVTALFHLRYVNAQREFLATRQPWGDFALIATGELAAVTATVWWLLRRLEHPKDMEIFAISFLAGTVVRYILRKEMLQDIRGLRREIRMDDAR